MLPPVLYPKGQNILISRFQTAGEIAGAIVKAIKESEPSAEYLKKYFYAPDKITSLKRLFYFTKKAVPYKKEPGTNQTAKTLPRILIDANKQKSIGGVIGGDCKHYAIICGSIGKALKIPMRLRLIAQGINPTPNHIYCIAKINGRDIIIDPVLNSFNTEARYNYKYDVKI